MSERTRRTPKVSVLMTTHNRAPFIPEAVESVLRQTLRDFELVIVDDGSDESTRAMLRAYALADDRIELIEQDNAGIFAAANRGLAACRSPLVARLDSDDAAEPERLEEQVGFMGAPANRGVVCCGSFMKLIDGRGRFLTVEAKPTADRAIQEDLLRGHCAIGHPSSIIRRAALEKIGGYDSAFTSAGDLDVFLRLGEVGRLANVSAPLTRYRLHAASVSERKGREQRANCRRACESAWARRGETRPFEGHTRWRPGADRASRLSYTLQYGWWAWKSGELGTSASYGLDAVRLAPWRKEAWMLWLKSRWGWGPSPAEVADSLKLEARGLTVAAAKLAEAVRAARAEGRAAA